MQDVLTILWAVVGLLGPVFAFIVGRPVWRALTTQARLGLAAGAIVVFLAALWPLSFPSSAANHAALVVAYLTLAVLAAGAARTAVPRGVVSVVATPVVLLLLYAVFGASAFFLNGSYVSPERTAELDCGYTVHLNRYGWVASSGVEAVVYWRPAVPIVQVERARHRFSDVRFDPAQLSVRSEREGGRCYAVVTYAGEEVWRAP